MTARVGQDKLPAAMTPMLARLAPTFALAAAAGTLDAEAIGARRDRLAGALAAAGVGRGGVVALAAARTPDTCAAILAALHLGAACLPLDPGYPRDRLVAMLEDARPDLLLGPAAGLDAFAAAGCARLTLEAALAAPVTASPATVEDDDALAYILFTSGSTGRPKGVAMRRGPLTRLIAWHVAHPRLGRAARTLQFAPLGFDVAFQELLSTAATGGTLVLPSEAERRDPYALLALIERERIERTFLPYVALATLAEATAAGGAVPGTLRDVITAGEQLRITPAIRALFAVLPDAVLHNHYGPTETHVVAAHELAGDPANWPELPPIGRPLPHVRARLVDTALRDVAADSPGELLLGGDCLAAGYIHRPELTAERFIELGGARWYRTGDEVRDTGAGVLACLGRLDEQIKIDGYRIEPAEIEAALVAHPAVAEAAVVAVEDAAGRRLVAHVVPRELAADETALAATLRAHCAVRLAPYALPRAFAFHAVLPLTPSGKIDRRELARGGAARALDWPEGVPLEQQLAALWRQLLDLAELDPRANLFDLGARSLTVVRALTELRRHGFRTLTAVGIYEHPSVAALAAHLGAAPAAATAATAAQQRGEQQRAALARFGPHSGVPR